MESFEINTFKISSPCKQTPRKNQIHIQMKTYVFPESQLLVCPIF